MYLMSIDGAAGSWATLKKAQADERAKSRARSTKTWIMRCCRRSTARESRSGGGTQLLRIQFHQDSPDAESYASNGRERDGSAVRRVQHHALARSCGVQESRVGDYMSDINTLAEMAHCRVCDKTGNKIFSRGKIKCSCGGQKTCPACKGTGMRDCWQCQGSGFVERGSPGAAD